MSILRLLGDCRSLRAHMLICVALLVCLALPSVAHAQTDSLAEQLFRSAKAAMAKGDVARACAEFDQSLRLEPATGTQLNLADCEEKAGRRARALALFQSARQGLPPADFRIPFVEQRIAVLVKLVPEINVMLNGNPPPGTRILRGNEEIRPGSWLRMDIGNHLILVKVPGREDQRIELTLSAGDRRILDIDLTPPADVRASRRRTLAYLAGTVGVAGVAVGVVTGIMTINAASTYEDHCRSGQCDAEGLEAASTGRRYEVVSPIAFAVGALGLGTGAYLLLTAPSAKNGITARVTPLVSPRLGGVALHASF